MLSTPTDTTRIHALVLENELQYRELADGRINSSNDQATSDINLVGF